MRANVNVNRKAEDPQRRPNRAERAAQRFFDLVFLGLPNAVWERFTLPNRTTDFQVATKQVNALVASITPYAANLDARILLLR